MTTTKALLLWLKRLLGRHLVKSAGRSKAAHYFVDLGWLLSLKFTDETTLKRIEPQRLVALVFEDLQRYTESAFSDIHQHIGSDIHPKQVKRAL